MASRIAVCRKNIKPPTKAAIYDQWDGRGFIEINKNSTANAANATSISVILIAHQVI